MESKPVFDDEAFIAFIHGKAKRIIGEQAIIGSAAIVFEFMGTDGRVGFSVLRPPGHDMEDTIDLLVNATETIVIDYHKNKNFGYGDGLDEFPEQNS
jgi:hypothetical protein